MNWNRFSFGPSFHGKNVVASPNSGELPPFLFNDLAEVFSRYLLHTAISIISEFWSVMSVSNSTSKQPSIASRTFSLNSSFVSP